jgi:hypothetical protein
MCLLREDVRGWFSAVLGRRTPGVWAIIAIVGAVATATVLLIGMQAAQASHPEVSLAGSDFEIDTDANLVSLSKPHER